jgi:hypothetical protein
MVSYWAVYHIINITNSHGDGQWGLHMSTQIVSQVTGMQQRRNEHINQRNQQVWGFDQQPQEL